MDSYPTKLAEAFSQKIIEIFFDRALTPLITNDEYEGEIQGKATLLNIPTVIAPDLQTYDGNDLDDDEIMENVGQLNANQMRAFNIKVKSLDVLKSFIKNPEGNVLDQLTELLLEASDNYVLGFYADVAAGNRVGTDYSTGTVTVDAETGVVTGDGTTFTSAMVGRGFKAAGHTKWYRVKSVASTTSLVIEDDFDDVDSAYTGGAISAGAAFVIEAVTAVQVTKDNIYAKLEALNVKLNERKVPRDNRWIALPPSVASLIRQSSQYTPELDSAYKDVIKNGLVTKMANFMVYESNQYSGDSTNGWHILGGHKSAIVFGMAMTESEIEPFIAKNFGKRYKGLDVYGAKVPDYRRCALVEGFFKL
jgi:hypothetical protein